MNSLPNPLTTCQLDGILATLATLPSADITRHNLTVTVHATRKKDGQRVKVLSAITNDGKLWAVMAVSGLISTN